MLDEKTARDFGAMGVHVDEDLVEDEPAFEVWRTNMRSVSAFLSCSTQWRWVVGFGVAFRTGIDYASARPVFERRGRRINRRLFDDVRLMESAALEAFGEIAP